MPFIACVMGLILIYGPCILLGMEPIDDPDAHAGFMVLSAAEWLGLIGIVASAWVMGDE